MNDYNAQNLDFNDGKAVNLKRIVRQKFCDDCKYYEENGIHFSSEPECIKLKEYASNAINFCDGPYLK